MPSLRFPGTAARAWLAVPAIPALALALCVNLACAGDAVRGRLVYETRCTECHERSVHGRDKRVAASCEEVREHVLRWSREAGAGWTDEEVEDVTAWLNERYYHFPVKDGRCVKSVARVRVSR